MKARRWLVALLTLLGLGGLAFLAAMLFGTDRYAPDSMLTDIASLTPPGSSVAEVEAALRRRGWNEGMGGVEGADGQIERIDARCADFYRLGLPPERMVIQAHWHFGDDGKLRDIALDYYQAGLLGFSKENETPILLSDRKPAR